MAKTKAETVTARVGSFVSIPLGGTVHDFKNESSENAGLLCIVVPAGLEQMFREIGQPVVWGEFLPTPALGPEDAKRLAEVAARYSQQVFPPASLR